MNIRKTVSNWIGRICLTVPVLACVLAGSLGAQPYYPATAIGANKLWAAPYKVEGTGISVAVFEAGGRPDINHDRLRTGTGAAILQDMMPTAALRDHATAVTGIIGANSGGGMATTGIARRSTIFLYSHAVSTDPMLRDRDMETFFKTFFRTWVDAERDNWRISNHSYGADGFAGWREVKIAGVYQWVWYGVPGTQELYRDSAIADPKFGWYGPLAQQLDLFCGLYPEQITVFSAGNFNSDGPPKGTTSYRRILANGTTQLLTAQNPAKVPQANGGALGYDCIEGFKTAKNGIMVGSVDRVGGVWKHSTFSSAGPTDDGRIKPDVVAYGDKIKVLTINNGTKISSGTSYAAPAVTGVLAQLAELWERSNPAPMTSATARALLCHTAKDLGNAGPDYHFGWGLTDAVAAAALVNVRSLDGRFALQERALKNGMYDTIYIRAKAKAKVKVTIAWTDPAANPIPANANGVPPLDDRTPRLRNDLDLRIYPVTGASDNQVGINSLPWALDYKNPAALAGRKDNVVDNIEQVNVTAPSTLDNITKKGVYMIVVRHKHKLRNLAGIESLNAVQNYSIAIGGASEYLPAPQSIIAKSTGATSKRLTWRRVANATAYDVEYRTPGSNTWVSKGQSALTQTDFTNVQNGTWLARVRTRRGTILGPWSATMAFIIGQPSPPSGLHVTNVTTTSALLRWTGVAGASGYEVAYSPIRADGTRLWDEFKMKVTTDTKLNVTGLPPDEYIAWFVRTKAGADGSSEYIQADAFVTPNDCGSYEPGDNQHPTARVGRIGEYFTGRLCKNDPKDLYLIDPVELYNDRYMRVHFDAHSRPYGARLYRQDRNGGFNQYSIVAGTSITLGPTDRSIVYNQLDFTKYYYWVEIFSSSPATIYSDSERYSFWIETRNTQPFGAGREGESDPSLSMYGGSGGRTSPDILRSFWSPR